jgi:hypothetical protein
VYRQVLDPLASPALTALVAALPLLLLLVLLGVLGMKSRVAGLAGLVVTVLFAVAVYRMPLGQAVNGAFEGVAFGLFPIVWITVNAVWANKLQRSTGHFGIVGRTFSSLSAIRESRPSSPTAPASSTWPRWTRPSVHTSGTGGHPRGRHLLTAAGDRARTPGPSPRVPEALATGLRLPAGPARRATLRSTWRSSPSATRGTPAHL